MGCDSLTGVRRPDRGRSDVQEYGFISFSQRMEDKWLPIVGKRDKNAFMGLKSGFKELYKYKGTLGALGALGEGRALSTKVRHEKNHYIVFVHLTLRSQPISRHHLSSHLRRRISHQRNPRPGSDPPQLI